MDGSDAQYRVVRGQSNLCRSGKPGRSPDGRQCGRSNGGRQFRPSGADEPRDYPDWNRPRLGGDQCASSVLWEALDRDSYSLRHLRIVDYANVRMEVPEQGQAEFRVRRGTLEVDTGPNRVRRCGRDSGVYLQSGRADDGRIVPGRRFRSLVRSARRARCGQFQSRVCNEPMSPVTAISIAMAIGWWWRSMAGCGGPESRWSIGRLIGKGVGPTGTPAAGLGCRTSLGDGSPIITAGGHDSTDMAGAGDPETSR
jgi:hypothetical protein